MSDPSEPGGATTHIVIVSGGCCIPGMAAFDEQARRVVDEAISQTGVRADVTVIPATTAMMGGAPKELMARLMGDFQESGHIGLPAVLVDGEAVSLGVPTVDLLKPALLGAVGVDGKDG